MKLRDALVPCLFGLAVWCGVLIGKQQPRILPLSYGTMSEFPPTRGYQQMTATALVLKPTVTKNGHTAPWIYALPSLDQYSVRLGVPRPLEFLLQTPDVDVEIRGKKLVVHIRPQPWVRIVTR